SLGRTGACCYWPALDVCQGSAKEGNVYRVDGKRCYWIWYCLPSCKSCQLARRASRWILILLILFILFGGGTMAKEHKYFVSYVYSEGWGNIDVTLPEPIQNIDDIRSMEQAITENQELDELVCV